MNTPKMEYRSLALLRSWPTRDLVELGADLGFNALEFIGGGVSSHLDFRRLADEEGFFDWADEFDMSTALWIREFDDYNRSWWGEPALENEHLWTGIRRRYETICELYPEVDYFALKTVESHEWITDPAVLERLISVINDVCREYEKTLIYRSFLWHPEQLEGVRTIIDGLPEDVVIMTKCVGNDWNYRASHHPLIGDVGAHDQYVEIDIASEYHRLDDVANAFTDEIRRRFDYWVEQGVTGIHVRPLWAATRERTDRAEDPVEELPWSSHSVVGKAQEANLWALGRLATGEADADSDDLEGVWREFATRRFGAAAADTMIEVLRPTGEVVEEALCVDRETFGDPRRRIPAIMTMEGRTAERRTDEEAESLPAQFEAYLEGRETPTDTTHSFQLDTNPFARNWSTWRWDPSYRPTYHRLRKGHPETVEQKERAVREARASARESLERLETVADDLPEDGYEFVRFTLRENEFLLEVMSEMELAWLKASNRLYYDEGDDERIATRADVETHLERLAALTDRYGESVECTWRGIPYELHRGEYVDIDGYLEEFRRYWEL
ncbi:hypothetical protein [Natronoglomus mannanivorans]|uniref:Uncharacterized protein n=1 Tax=Natronoglomus mannanivorans TaxID=2979990 RepID=A0AAP2YVF0_9EURY|nr:hypothetical protein [Halobacteria archaeon AArc-xg1-1]